MVDPLRFAIAVVPLAAYGLVIGVVNARQRPFLTSGGCDLLAFGLALAGLIFVGPLELFRPEAATLAFGNYVWLFLLLFYGLVLLLAALLGRPRLVVYNIRIDELHPVVAEVASHVDPAARWAGNHLSLPGLGVQLHLESFDVMRNVSLISSGSRQSIDGWRRLARELATTLGKVRVKRNPRSLGFTFVSLLLLLCAVVHLLNSPATVAQAVVELFSY